MMRLCQYSKELYNRCNYLMRKAWFTPTKDKYKNIPNINVLTKETKDLACFKGFGNTKTAKQTIRKVISDWSNYFKALKAYGKDPSKFIMCPKPPGYKNKLSQVIFYWETIKRGKKVKGITPTNNLFETIPWDNNIKFKQVTVTPKAFGFMIDVQYDNGIKPIKKKLDKNKQITIDTGLNVLAAITLDEMFPILVNGRILKSINQWYNKNPCKSRLRKRYFRIENYFHHVSKGIIELCQTQGIGRIVIGKNDGWKQNINLKAKTNQAFMSIAHFNLLQKIQYKAIGAGIDVVFTEESYTSKASFFDNDFMPVYDPDKKTEYEFSGKRKYRGLYVSNSFAINADVNGSLNIGRKVIPEFFEKRIGDRSLAARPVIINPLRKPNGEGWAINDANN